MIPEIRKNAVRLAALTLAPLSAALGQIQGINGATVRTFEPAYFQEFDPRTAREMVERIPGVSMQETDGGRGLSGVRSNLLINGERPPPKGKSISEQLDEIPVGGIERIELIDAGARLDIDMQGFPQVINVITVEGRPTYYEVVTEMQRSGTGNNAQENERVSELDGTSTFFLAEHEITIAGNFQDRNNRSPAEFVAIDPANPTQRIGSLNTFDRKEEGFQLDAMFALPGESTLGFNSRFTSDTRGSMPLVLIVDDALEAVDESSDSKDDLREFSSEYRRPIASSGELMLAFVDTTSTSLSESIFRSTGLNRFSLSDSETGETATRLLLTNAPTERLTIRTNVSNAFNYFNGGFQIFVNDEQQDIEGSNSRVEEDRRSLEGSVDWVLTDKLTFRGALGIEQYLIETRDVSSGTQTDPKGEISISYRPQPRTTYSLSTSRSVGQLAFSQFLASSNLSSEILTAGASELEPERQRDITATYDRRFGDRGVMRFSLSRTETENPVNSVALDETTIVSQNTQPAITDSLQLSIDLPMTRFGRDDIILSLSGRFSDSKTIDPITGEEREVSSGGSGNYNRGGGGGNFSGGGGNFSGGGGNFSGGGGNFNSGFMPRHYKQIELRKNPGDGKWSWQVSARDVQPTGNYSARQIRNSTGEQQWNASLTFEPINGLRIRGNVDGPRTQSRLTTFYATVREPGLDPSYVAETLTRRGRFYSLSVEWRRERLEITGSLSSRPEYETVESLTPFGEMTGLPLTSEIDRTPRATLRFRIIS